jgi:hypothetical protein
LKKIGDLTPSPAFKLGWNDPEAWNKSDSVNCSGGGGRYGELETHVEANSGVTHCGGGGKKDESGVPDGEGHGGSGGVR